MKQLYVPLNPDEFEALKALARTERRRPQDQAAAMLAPLLAAPPEDDEPRRPEVIAAVTGHLSPTVAGQAA